MIQLIVWNWIVDWWFACGEELLLYVLHQFPLAKISIRYSKKIAALWTLDELFLYSARRNGTLNQTLDKITVWLLIRPLNQVFFYSFHPLLVQSTIYHGLYNYISNVKTISSLKFNNQINNALTDKRFFFFQSLCFNDFFSRSELIANVISFNESHFLCVLLIIKINFVYLK